MHTEQEATAKPELQPLRLGFLAVAWRGFFMGAADVVPGVSGGTIALIVGIYERLIKAISRVDGALIRLLLARRFREAASYLDLAFLFSLGCGIVVGLGAAIFTVNKLLGEATTRPYTLAAFFGMIFASGILVARLVEAKSVGRRATYVLIGIAAAAFAYWVSSLTEDNLGEPSLPYIFASGCIAICAMILPGISGAMILLLLGVYEHLTHIPKQMLHGEQVTEGLLTIAVFGSGCFISLVCFSKFLRWLLRHHHSPTMAMLCGLLFGGLRKLWPFLIDRSPGITEFRHKHFDVRWPTTMPEFLSVAAVAVIAGVAILAAEHLVGDKSTKRNKAANAA